MYVTFIGLSGYCPHIDETVTLSGKYGFGEDVTKARFLCFTCPIVENAKLEPYEQEEKYKYLKPCNNIYDCPIAKGFKEIISL